MFQSFEINCCTTTIQQTHKIEVNQNKHEMAMWKVEEFLEHVSYYTVQKYKLYELYNNVYNIKSEASWLKGK